MKQKPKSIVIAAGILLCFAVPLIIYLTRPPVLIVTDMAFIPFYGESRIKSEIRLSSFSLFRRVIVVPIADGVSPDIVMYAVIESSPNPYCVIFPLRFAEAANLYRRSFPVIPVVILEGRESYNPSGFAIGENRDDFFIFSTDITREFYLAGLVAGILNEGSDTTIAVFTEPYIEEAAREAFLNGLNDPENLLETSFFPSIHHYTGIENLSCAVLTSAGTEFMERNPDIPIIFLTWINPEILPDNVIMVINDSPFAQITRAVRMVTAGHKTGQIRSKKLILPGANIDNETKKLLRKY